MVGVANGLDKSGHDITLPSSVVGTTMNEATKEQHVAERQADEYVRELRERIAQLSNNQIELPEHLAKSLRVTYIAMHIESEGNLDIVDAKEMAPEIMLVLRTAQSGTIEWDDLDLREMVAATLDWDMELLEPDAVIGFIGFDAEDEANAVAIEDVIFDEEEEANTDEDEIPLDDNWAAQRERDLAVIEESLAVQNSEPPRGSQALVETAVVGMLNATSINEYLACLNTHIAATYQVELPSHVYDAMREGWNRNPVSDLEANLTKIGFQNVPVFNKLSEHLANAFAASKRGKWARQRLYDEIAKVWPWIETSKKSFKKEEEKPESVGRLTITRLDDPEISLSAEIEYDPTIDNLTNREVERIQHTIADLIAPDKAIAVAAHLNKLLDSQFGTSLVLVNADTFRGHVRQITEVQIVLQSIMSVLNIDLEPENPIANNRPLSLEQLRKCCALLMPRATLLQAVETRLHEQLQQSEVHLTVANKTITEQREQINKLTEELRVLQPLGLYQQEHPKRGNTVAWICQHTAYPGKYLATTRLTTTKKTTTMLPKVSGTKTTNDFEQAFRFSSKQEAEDYLVRLCALRRKGGIKIKNPHKYEIQRIELVKA